MVATFEYWLKTAYEESRINSRKLNMKYYSTHYLVKITDDPEQFPIDSKVTPVDDTYDPSVTGGPNAVFVNTAGVKKLLYLAHLAPSIDIVNS